MTLIRNAGCPPSIHAGRSQAPRVRRFAAAVRGEAMVLAVVTAPDEPFLAPGPKDARRWAGKPGLSPAHVFHGTEPDNRVIPQHLLIDPDGRTWYRYIGFLEADAMCRTLADFRGGGRPPQVRKLPAR